MTLLLTPPLGRLLFFSPHRQVIRNETRNGFDESSSGRKRVRWKTITITGAGGIVSRRPRSDNTSPSVAREKWLRRRSPVKYYGSNKLEASVLSIYRGPIGDQCHARVRGQTFCPVADTDTSELIKLRFFFPPPPPSRGRRPVELRNY